MPKKTPGPEIPVPGKDFRPFQRDTEVGCVGPVRFVMDLGAPRDGLEQWRGVPSPASATFKAGKPMGVNPSLKPEPESLPIHTGRLNYHRDQKDVTPA